MTAPDPIDVAINQIDEKKEKLKKAFDDLQRHRSLLSPSFTLSWSEIGSHFSSLKSSLINRFRLLQSAAPCPESDKIEASKEDVGTQFTEDTTETPVLWPQLITFCEKMDGIGLGKYMIDHSKKRLTMKVDLSASIRCSQNPAALVLDAIEGSYNLPSSSSAKQIDGRRIFVLLLETLIEINSNLTDDLRERARTLAYDWKSKIGNKPSEALGFLHLVAAFELESLFNTEELADYILMISTYKQATSICKKIGLGKERIADLIHKLLNSDKQLIAIRFIYEFEMTDKFQPVSILKSILKNSREAAKKICVEGKDSLKSQNEATDKELSGLRAVIKVIKEQNIESEFSQENLEECVKKLENQKAQRRRATKSTTHGNPQQPQHLQNKVTKRPRIASNGTPAGYNLRMPMPNQQQPLLHNPNHSLQVNPYGLVNSTLPGVIAPYGNPLVGFYGSAPAPRPPYYDQQMGNKGYDFIPQLRPPYFPH